MLLLALIIIPALAGLWALLAKRRRLVLALLIGAASAHSLITLALWLLNQGTFSLTRGLALSPYFALDTAGLLFLSLTSGLFFVSALYTVPYLTTGAHDPHASPQRFVACLLWFLAAMSLVTVSQHLAVMWAAIEATTLASAPLIYFYRRKAALEAAWKYLLICSVGIALALLGTFFLGIAAVAASGSGGHELVLGTLIDLAPRMPRVFLKAAFIMALVGYGTKMGLVPLHTWLPDAHSQAPSPVSALLSGSLLNCAFLGILRFYQIAVAAGDAAFASHMFLVLGFASLGVAAAFMVRQRDYKRLLAYSSVENMGIMAIGIGIGGAAVYGALLHVVNHALVKVGLFLLAGNVLRHFGTTQAGAVRSVWARLPGTGVLLVIGLLAVGGMPPFGPFMTELMIFKAALGASTALAALFVGLLAVAFIGMAGVLLPMLQGSPATDGQPRVREGALTLGPPLVLCAAVAVLGVYVPDALGALLQSATALFGG